MVENIVQKSIGRTHINNYQKLKVFTPNNDIFKFSFFPRTVIDWNSLSEDQVEEDTVLNLKAKINRMFD